MVISVRHVLRHYLRAVMSCRVHTAWWGGGGIGAAHKTRCYIGGPQKGWQSGSGSRPRTHCVGYYLCVGERSRGGPNHAFSASKSRGELRVDKGKYILKGGRAPVEAVFSGAAVTATPAVYMVRHCAHSRVVFVVDGPDAVIYRKGISGTV